MILFMFKGLFYRVMIREICLKNELKMWGCIVMSVVDLYRCIYV